MPRSHMHGGDVYRSRTPPIRIAADNKETTAATLEAIAAELVRLSVDHRNPERFHEVKSDLIDRLRRLARSPLVTPPPKVRFIPGPERVKTVERVVLVNLFRPPRRRKPESGVQYVLPLGKTS